MSSLAWKLNRLRLMGAPELAWRAGQVAQRAAERLGLGLAQAVPPATGQPAGWRIVDPSVLAGTAARQSLLASADRLLAGHWQVFALRDLALGFPPVWNRCPKTGTLAPMSHGTAIDYRREDRVGDIKYLWEPSRHLELVTLAMAWSTSGEPRYALAARQLVGSWIEQCPYPRGVHWASALEVAIRLLNWAVAWPLLDVPGSPVFAGDAGAAFRAQWLAAVYRHCHFLSTHGSRHSSANNHLFGELMGLFVGALQWPCWPQSPAWLAAARAGLEREAVTQVGADGVNREQAVYYHHEVMDMMLLCDRFAAAAGHPFSPEFAARLEAMAGYLHAVMDCGGHVPMIGDADDATMLRLSGDDHPSPYASLLASCALRFARPDLKAKAGALDGRTHLLFGADAPSRWRSLPAAGPEAPRLAFPDGGYFLLGSGFGGPDEVRAVVDCGPLGYLSIAAHGHADALAFTLSLGGTEVLIDPGTYCYHTRKPWRDHFRGTAAHNTVQVDGLDQSVIGGNFMWLHKADSTLLAHQPTGDEQHFEGRHDGYRRLPDPVTHQRRIVYRQSAARIDVTDSLVCRTAHHVALHWQFAEHCTARLQDGAVVVSAGPWQVVLTCDAPGLVPGLLHGSEAPMGGWVSRVFDHKQPATTARWQGRIEAGTAIRTTIRFQRLASAPVSTGVIA